MTPAWDLDYKHFSESTVENPKLKVLVDIGKAYLMLPKYMNVGNDWKNTRGCMPTGELWGMEQSIPMAISKETRSPEIQHFPWASGKQLRSCTNLRRPPSSFCCAPTTGRGLPISQELTDQRRKPSSPASRYGAANSGGGSAGRPWGRPRREPPQPRERVGPREQRGNFFSWLDCPGQLCRRFSQTLDVCTCPCVHPPLPGRRF